MRMTVPGDLVRRAAPLVGAPFLAKGDTPDGWDCRGLTRWCLRTFSGIEVPDYLDLYEAAIVCPAGTREPGGRYRLKGAFVPAFVTDIAVS